MKEMNKGWGTHNTFQLTQQEFEEDSHGKPGRRTIWVEKQHVQRS